MLRGEAKVVEYGEAAGVGGLGALSAVAPSFLELSLYFVHNNIRV
jgi:hypothetical protein